jgi:AhpC/TSA family
VHRARLFGLNHRHASATPDARPSFGEMACPPREDDSRHPYNEQLLFFFLMEESVTLKTGDYAPDFELPAVTGTERQKFKLSDWRGKKNVVLAFYALDWSPT